MDPNPKTFPILSYVLSRLPQLGSKPSASDSPGTDIEAGDVGGSTSAAGGSGVLVDQMPHLSDPKVLASMTNAISDVAQTRSVLQTLGERPDHEAVDKAKAKIAELDSRLSKRLEEIVLSPRPENIDRMQYRAHQAEKEQECRKAAEKEKQIYKAVLQLDEMHEAYEKLLKEAEERLVKLYESASAFGDDGEVKEEVNEEVVGILQEASGKGLERVDLSGRRLRFLPEAFGKIRSLVSLNLSSNQLEVSVRSLI